MDRSAAAVRAAESTSFSSTTSGFMRWEEVVLSNEKGKRDVRYYLKRRDGSSDLAVVGKEKVFGQISYHYAKSFLSPSLLKLKSRREVIDWLSSIVSDAHRPRSPQPLNGDLERGDACGIDADTFKDIEFHRNRQYPTEFLWVGSAWACRKKRKHYNSFRRNGVRISVHDFVYVLAEEDKRLVAYLDDMYEDSRGNKMVVVQWFHKVDEVGIALPQGYNDREIFFSLCLQDLSIECIDGLATVLSPQHYENFLHKAAHEKFEPFVCHRQFDNDDIKPFNITEVKGYWKQQIFGYLSTSSASKALVKCQAFEDDSGATHIDATGTRPNKRLRHAKDTDDYVWHTNERDAKNASFYVPFQHNKTVVSEDGVGNCILKDRFAKKSSSVVQKSEQNLKIGSHVEVLSQDSGIRGCWFRAVIIKRHKNKMKVKYEDIKDAVDESVNLEEWILAARVALPDQSSIRLPGRASVRPIPMPVKSSTSWVDVGSVVDAWWHDGWWEGIVFHKESEDRTHVYFPGEKQQSVFVSSDLRPSQEWLGDRWEEIKGRREPLSSILPDLETNPVTAKSCNITPIQSTSCGDKDVSFPHRSGLSAKCRVRDSNIRDHLDAFQDQDSKGDLFSHLKWNWSRKRRPIRKSSRKLNCTIKKSRNSLLRALEPQPCDSFVMTPPFEMDHDNCKFIKDSSLFGSSVVSPLSSLVYV